MKTFRIVLAATALAASLGAPSFAQLPTTQDPRIEVFVSSERAMNSITRAPDGRTFMSLPGFDKPGPQVVEVKGGKFFPFPNAEWSVWNPAKPQETLLHVNTVRVGPDGNLWVVDAGDTRVGGKATPGAAKIVVIDLKTSKIARTYKPDPAVLREYSYINDIRFNGRFAYIPDSAAIHPAILVLDLKSGKMRRVLEDHPATIASHDMFGAGGKVEVLKDPIPDSTGKMINHKRDNVDQLEVSPDGKWFYFHPIGGPLSRVPTRLLDDPGTPKDKLAAAVEKVIDTWTVAGTVIDAAGNIYLSKLETQSIMKLTPDGKLSTLVSDPRLDAVDAMWIDRAGYLYMPAAQTDRIPANLGGAPSKVTYPVLVLRMQIHQKPAPNDHR